MENTIAYIESYFEQNHSEKEKEDFDVKIKTDPSFAQEVSFYLQAKALAKIDQKNKFKVLSAEISKRPKPIWKTMAIFSAAASILILCTWIFFMKQNSPEQYASHFIDNNFRHLSTQMASEKSSFSEGIEAYNQRRYNDAIQHFKGSDALSLEYAGLCRLQLKQYENAIACFQQLSEIKDIYQNKGLFYEALTQIEKGESLLAKPLLLEIIQAKGEVWFGKKEATNLLELIEK
jgi:tetratricopeptide (TPR) repeat protein